MTFSALSYLVWYRTYRMYIKEMIHSDNYSNAQSLLEDLVVEHKAKMPNDHSVLQSELRHMEHCLKHIKVYDPLNDPTGYGKYKLMLVVSYEPFQSQE